MESTPIIHAPDKVHLVLSKKELEMIKISLNDYYLNIAKFSETEHYIKLLSKL
jgi:hypothetical protein